MNQNSYLCKYIAKHPNWLEELPQYPYFIDVVISDAENFALFKYNMLRSKIVDHKECHCDFSYPEQREARGIIIDLNTLEVLCWPFNKFANIHEPFADEINWQSAKVQEKVDGAIMKLWWDPYKNQWRVSSNGMIDASDKNKYADNHSFEELFYEAAGHQKLDYSRLNKENTYIFELVSPYSKIIISYPETKIYHLGTRNKNTGQELNEDIGIVKPKLYDLHSVDDCIKAAKMLNKNTEGYDVVQEGFVVVDKNWHRVKIKSPKYLDVSYLFNNGNLTDKRIVKIILQGETSEYKSYYPQSSEDFDRWENDINLFKNYLQNFYNDVLTDWLSRYPDYMKDRETLLPKCKEIRQISKVMKALSNQKENSFLNIKLRTAYEMGFEGFNLNSDLFQIRKFRFETQIEKYGDLEHPACKNTLNLLVKACQTESKEYTQQLNNKIDMLCSHDPTYKEVSRQIAELTTINSKKVTDYNKLWKAAYPKYGLFAKEAQKKYLFPGWAYKFIKDCMSVDELYADLTPADIVEAIQKCKKQAIF